MSRSSDNSCHSFLSRAIPLVLGGSLICCILSTCIHGASADQTGLPNRPNLFPFGVTADDVRGPRGDDSASSRVTLEVPFTFIGTEYTRIVVNSNGVLSFERSFTSCCGSRIFPLFSSPLVAPFWHDFDPSNGGNIYYRQTNDSQQLQLFSLFLSDRGVADFSPTLLFIATWDQVPQYFRSPLINNTLQVVLATDNVQTLAVFIYKDINWGERAQIGFNVGDGYTAFVFPEALSDETRSINEYSNVGEPGVFIYHIDEPPLLKLSGMLPFGPNVGDYPGPPGDDSSSKPLTLGASFPFFGKEYNKIIVNSNGVLSFDTPFTNCCPPKEFPLVSPPLIAPFWLDFDLTGTSQGGIYYGQTDDSTYLELIHILLNNVENVGDLTEFFPTKLFIATWEKVPEHGGSTSVQNTFQVVLATDGAQTVSIFIYHDIRWGYEAQAGFNAGDGQNSFALSEALTEQTRYLDQRSNIGEPGVFVYRIDVPPDQAHALSVESSVATSISISWQPPTLTNLHVLYYLVNINNLNSTVDDIITKANTTNNATSLNVTGLLPGTTYELTAVAVSVDVYRGNNVSTSQPSSSVMTTTGFIVPALSCDPPTSANGVITVTWSFIHTGGLPLTNLILTYSYTHSIPGNYSTESVTNRSQLNTVSVGSVDSTSIVVPNLVTGAEYVFNVTAENSYGSSSIVCGPTPHLIGRPAIPEFGDLISGPNTGEISVTLKTSSAGINRQSSSDFEVFWFMVTAVHEGAGGANISHLSMNYQSGTFETVIISGLEEGESYTLNATAVNVYGRSQVATSASITAGRSAMNTGAVVGAAVGGGVIILVVITLLPILILVVKVLFIRRGKTEIGSVESVLMNRVASVRITRNDIESEAVYEEPGSLPRHISLRDSDSSMFQLEQCPAYGVSTLTDT